MPIKKGYEDPAAKGMAGDPPGKAKDSKPPSKGYSDGNQDGGKSHGPTIGKTGGKTQGYDGAGIGADTSRGGFSKKTKYPG